MTRVSCWRGYRTGVTDTYATSLPTHGVRITCSLFATTYDVRFSLAARVFMQPFTFAAAAPHHFHYHFTSFLPGTGAWTGIPWRRSWWYRAPFSAACRQPRRLFASSGIKAGRTDGAHFFGSCRALLSLSLPLVSSPSGLPPSLPPTPAAFCKPL